MKLPAKNITSLDDLTKIGKNNESIKQLITTSIRDELKNYLSEMPNFSSSSSSRMAEPVKMNGNAFVLKKIFETYSNPEAGIVGVSQANSLQFA